MKPHPLFLLCLGLCSFLPAPRAAEPAAARAPFVPAPILPGGMVLPLFPPDSPHLKRERLHEVEQYNTTLTGGSARIQSVIGIHHPTIEVHLAGARTGAAVIVAPGGGHRILWVGPEGGDLVPFFANYGVATIILRNRLRVDGYEPKVDAVRDALQALRLVRSHAADWKLDPAKIGIMGFSAGAELAAAAALEYEAFQAANRGPADALAAVSARPDFVALVYPGPTPFAKDATPRIPVDVPPTFLMCPGTGDRVHALWATEYFTAMLKASVPNLEMHIYGNGTHGGSIKDRDGIPLGTWQHRYIDWFRDLGFLNKPGVETKAAVAVADYAKSRLTPAAAKP
ncbi:MAG: alpha/beta hydrolase fold domain-containing protein [Opitutaceae bacterium]|nr:alpha/beta hydrolase fold domain-containing protein [Opitutaceae bacterium]